MNTLTAIVNLSSPVQFMDVKQEYFSDLIDRFTNITFVFVNSFEELERKLDLADIVITWKFLPELYSKCPRLKAMFTPAAGRDWAPPDPESKVACFYGSFHGRMMGESLLGMILYFNNRIYKMTKLQEQHIWDRNGQYPMTLLDSQQVLFIGYGTIGRWCARMLRPLGCRMVGIQRKIQSGIDSETGVQYATMDNLQNEVGQADHIVLLLPNTPETRHLINRDIFGLMKKTAYLYNLGRGTVVNEDDLVCALDNKDIAGAGLDVFEQEPLAKTSRLWDFDNVIILPHSSAGYNEYGTLYVKQLEQQLSSSGL